MRSRQNPRILIIGRDGQVARALLDVLPISGADVTAIGQPQIDLLRPETVVTAIRSWRPSLVVNAAAYTAVDRAEDEPETARVINAEAPGVLAAAAAQVGAMMVHFSTDYVFDGSKRTPYEETDEPRPLGVYGATKLAGERAVVSANPCSVVLRTAWVCGAHGNNFLKTILRLAAEHPALRVVADQVGSPSFAADIAAAVAAIGERLHADAAPGPEHFGVFHITNAGTTTWHGLASAIVAAAARRGRRPVSVEAIATADYPTRAARPAYSKLATDKIKRSYGIHMPAWEASLEPVMDQLLGAAGVEG